jgi:glucan phosphoethanolaminetransferase (alkaline phosphatase superfamily)
MSDPISGFDPVPVVPLEYERPGGNAWVVVVRALCVLGAAFTSAAAGLEVAGACTRLMNGATGVWFPTFTGVVMVAACLVLLLRILLIVGCIACVRLGRAGWHMVVWSSGASVVVGLLQLIVFVYVYYDEFYGRQFGFSSAARRYYFANSVLSGTSNFTRDCLVPVLLWYFFRRPEVRALFRR